MLLNRDPQPEDRSPESDKGLISAMFTFVFGLAVVGAIFTALLYHRHSTRDTQLAEHGQRAPAVQTGRAERIDPRMGRDFLRIRYTYEAGGRTYYGAAGMYVVPASLSVVFDPEYPGTHRLVGSMNSTGNDQRTLVAWLMTAAIFGGIAWRARKLARA